MGNDSLSNATRHPIYLDSDLGIDDAMALGYLLASPQAELVGIGSTFGNVASTQAARNILDFLAVAGRSGVPVAIGATNPLATRFDGGAPQVHGANGIGDVVLPRSPQEPIGESSADLLIRLSHEYRGTLRIVAIGPLTNLALALQADPGLSARVDGVYIMGGAALVPGNVTPVSEANIRNDPEAAAAVFAADWPIVLAPLDVTMEHRLDESHRATLAQAPGAGPQVIAAMMEQYAEWYLPIYGAAEVALHDPLAAALAVGAVSPSVAPRVSVAVDTTSGPGRGQTIVDLRARFLGYPDEKGANVAIVLQLDDAFAPHLVERLAGLAP